MEEEKEEKQGRDLLHYSEPHIELFLHIVILIYILFIPTLFSFLTYNLIFYSLTLVLLLQRGEWPSHHERDLVPSDRKINKMIDRRL